MHRVFAVLALAGALLSPATGSAQSPEPTNAPARYCVDLVADDPPLDVGSFLAGVLAGTVTIVAIEPCDAIGTSESDPAAPVESMTFKGGKQESGASKRFELAPGSYKVNLRGKAREYSNVILDLESSAGDQHDLWNEITEKGSFAYETYLYDVDGGAYYWDYDLPLGSWTITVTPISD